MSWYRRDSKWPMSRLIKAGLGVLAGAVLLGGAFQIASKKPDEKGLILKGQVVKYDTASLVVAIEGDGEMYFSYLTSVSVWVIKDDGTGERPQKADWSKVAVGQRVSLSMDKSGQKLISVIIL